MEEWKTIPSFPNYAVSSLGKVKRIRKSHSRVAGKFLKLTRNSNGYVAVKLFNEGKYKTQKVHRLVAEAFIPNPNNLKDINHKKGNQKWNNKVSNLEWSTRSDNVLHAFATGLMVPKKGSSNGNSRLSESDVVEIKKLLKNGYTSVELSEMYPVTRQAIHLIDIGRNWAHIKI